MASIGPYIPPNLSNSPAAPSTAPSVGLFQRYEEEEEEEEEEEDDYAPALPPDLAAARINGGGPATAGPSRRIFGPSMGPQRQEEEESEDEEVGPAPLPSSVTLDPQDGIREFREKEEQRRKHIEVRTSHELLLPSPLFTAVCRRMLIYLCDIFSFVGTVIIVGSS